jgi:SAM-dependent methyltransferase
MHKEVSNFIKEVRSKHFGRFVGTRVLEVGSLDINGSVRKHFTLCRYTGIDLSKGKGVDLVHDISQPLLNKGQFDVVISTEMLEHARHWKDCLVNMYNLVLTGGLFILTCAGTQRDEHGTTRTSPKDSPFTNDHYRNIDIKDFSSALPPHYFDKYFIEERRDGKDLVFYGIKK